MLATNARRFFPICDDYGLLRAQVLIRPGREFESTQLAHRVVVAVSFTLGEKVHDWTLADPRLVYAEIARRASCRPPGFKDQMICVMEIADWHEPLVFVAVYRGGRERECQRMATLVNSTVSGFLRRRTQVLAYEM